MKVKQAMILAAGMGNRMRPLTDERPKPMVEIKGKPMIDYALEQLAAHGIQKCVVNTHYKADVLHNHLKAKQLPFELIISHEPVLLNTGGGIKNALQHFNMEQPVMVLAGDSILEGVDILKKLDAAWSQVAMDILLLLQPLSSMTLTPGVGDYDMSNGRPARSLSQSGKYMWTSARILNPRIFDKAPNGEFSFLPLMDAAEKSARLAAQISDGVWHHLTTPDDVVRVNKS